MMSPTPTLRSPDFGELLLRSLYYQTLTDYPPFALELLQLYERLSTRAPEPAAEGEDEGAVVMPGPGSTVPDWALAPIEALRRRWPLPAGVERDLWLSFLVWRGDPRTEGGKPRLFPAPRWGWGPEPASIDLGEPLRALAATAPSLPFDPVTDSPAELLARLDAVLEPLRRQVLAQAEALRRAAEDSGWQEPPHRPPDLGLRAERLLRRAVRKQSWQAIAYATGASDRHLVRRQVLADARLLGIALPGSGSGAGSGAGR
jgi:hypothetical protein